MTISVVFGTNGGSSGAATSITATQTFVAGDAGAIWLQWSGTTATLTSVSDGTNSYALVGSILRDANKALSYGWYYSATAKTGSATITATFSASVSSRAIQVFRVLSAGAAQVSAGQGQLTPGTGANAVTSGNMTPTSAPAAVIAATVNHSAASGITVGTGYTSLGTIAGYNAIAGDNSATEWQRITATTAIAGTFTSAVADSYDTIALVITEASSGNAVSLAKTDGADVLAAQIGPIVSASSATTDGADVLAASVGPVVAASSATTDGADVLAAAVNNSLAANSASSATTDGADVLAAQISPIVAASSSATDGADVLAASLSVLVAASSATTDGADTLAAQVAPIVAASSAKTDGADVLLANVDNAIGVSASSATTDGADVLAASVAPIVAASSATTDGADVLASNVAPIVAASSAKTDGADVLLANVDTAVGANNVTSATTDGADILAAQLGPVVAVSSAKTDGADVLAANLGPVVGVTSATTDGTDVLASIVTPVPASVSASAALVEGADILAALIDTGASGADTHDGAWHGYGQKRKKRYVVRKGDELLEFTTKAAAVKALKEPAKPVNATPIPLAEVKAYAEKIGQGKEYAAAIQAQEYEKALELRELALDEEDIELLLLHI